MLADLKATAEAIGSEVMGFPLRWDVENLQATSSKRPDIIIYRDDTGAPLASGEAKRPNTPEGEHTLVTSEVNGAIGKANTQGVTVCFTTNFFDLALWDATPGPAPHSERLIEIFDLVPASEANSPGWWKNMPVAARADFVHDGLKSFFERMRTVLFGGGIVRDVNEVVLVHLTRLTDRLVELLHTVMLRERDGIGLPIDLLDQSNSVSLDPAKDAEARYLVAQGVAEVMTAALFYRNISENFSIGPILAGTNPLTGPMLAKRITQSLKAATVTSGDYETIFGLTANGTWLLQRNEPAAVAGWKALLQFVESIQFEAVSSDVLGTIFERLISPERRHEMGQHYTQPRIARSMVAWALRSNTESIADLCCGAGTFLVEAYRHLSDSGIPHLEILDQVYGNDLDPFAVHLAAVQLATREIFKGPNYPTVCCGDAFSIRPGAPALDIHPLSGESIERRWPASGIDVIVGNPPYAERPAEPDKWSQALTLLEPAAVPRGLSGGNQAAWFALLAEALLSAEGRWALVLPVSVLQNSNLAVWRAWLRRGRDVTIWHSEIDVWFSDARVATCVVLAEPATGTVPRTTFVSLHSAVQGSYVNSGDIPLPIEAGRATIVDLSMLDSDADLLMPGIIPESLQSFSGSDNVAELDGLPGVQVASGNKLGHACYQLRDLNPESGAIVREVESQKVVARLNRKYLLPFLSSPKDERTGQFSRGPSWVLNAPAKVARTGALGGYITQFEKLGNNKSPTDSPSLAAFLPAWWNRSWHSTQIAVQIHPGFTHQVWWSDVAFIPKNNFHMVRFESAISPTDRELVAASLTSAFGALASLYLSSEVGCEGVRWLSLPQFAKWPVLDPARVADDDVAEVLDAYREYRVHEATEMHVMPSNALACWVRLTVAVAKAAGLDEACARSAVEEARTTCVRRTDRETLALAGRTKGGRGSSKSTLGRRVSAAVLADRDVAELIEMLTGGEQVLNLRGTVAVQQGTLNLGSLTPVPFEEGNLAEILGVGFEASPVLDPAQGPVLVGLAEAVRDRVRKALLPVTEAAHQSPAYAEMRDQIDKLFGRTLQDEVRRRLS